VNEHAHAAAIAEAVADRDTVFAGMDTVDLVRSGFRET
jgi:hypothetical protein